MPCVVVTVYLVVDIDCRELSTILQGMTFQIKAMKNGKIYVKNECYLTLPVEVSTPIHKFSFYHILLCNALQCNAMTTTNVYRPECSKPLKLANCSRLKLVLPTFALNLKHNSSKSEEKKNYEELVSSSSGSD